MRKGVVEIGVNEFGSEIEKEVVKTITNVLKTIQKENPHFSISDQTANSLLILCTTFSRQVEDLIAVEAQSQDASALFAIPQDNGYQTQRRMF